uniref:BTB domain-containing protein n=2 Tax=Branchiostoma floridae TaxID=7739 RepID=C3YKP2_BRAFL|eukprot:XP_002603099.1 hypothetical protein BRAFLDRAFT_259508 [Branchiostoma floridae]
MMAAFIPHQGRRVSRLPSIVGRYSPIRRPFCPTTEQRKVAGDERLVFNVSGHKYEVWRGALDAHPDTLLGRFDDREKFFNPDTNEYDLSTTPEMFKYILRFYTNGVLHFPKSDDIHFHTYLEEIEFFEIDPDEHMSHCCFEDYIDRKIQWDIAHRPKTVFVPETLREKLWQMVESPKANMSAQVFFYITCFFISLSVTATVMETLACEDVSNIGDPFKIARARHCRHVFFCIESACVVLFTAEYIIRLYASPNRSLYARSFMSVVDLVSIFPFYVGLCISEESNVQAVFDTLRVFRVFRVFKLCRSSPGMIMLAKTLKISASNLSSLCFALSMICLVFTTMMYYMEKTHNPEKFSSIPAVFWFTIITMTTVGYGDITPIGFIGKVLTGAWSIICVVILSFPLTILVDTFTAIRESAKARKEKMKQSHEEQTDESDDDDESL